MTDLPVRSNAAAQALCMALLEGGVITVPLKEEG